MAREERIVVLTGAGISAESGIKTFRAADGLWESHPIEDVATPRGFARNPELVHRFYNERRAQLNEVEPNPAHKALALLESKLGERFLLVSQNVDDLHARAGSKRLYAMHGELRKARCKITGEITEQLGDMNPKLACPCCGALGARRPHIVWFGEVPLHLDEIDAALRRATLFVAVGTSGQVYPAAGFAEQAKRYGSRTLMLNLDPSSNGDDFDEIRLGKASDIVPEWVQEILAAEC